MEVFGYLIPYGLEWLNLVVRWLHLITGIAWMVIAVNAWMNHPSGFRLVRGEALSGEVPLSIDTSKAPVARAALGLGAELVNDVTALRGDPELAGVVAESGAYLCLMHMLGEPRTMQLDPKYDDVVSEVAAFLEERLAFAVGAGIREELVCLDPGIGFGKTVEHNFELIRRLDELTALGRPVVIGFSRKSSLGKLLGDPQATTGSVAASVGAAVAAYERGATILRVHDVQEHVEALAAARAALA